VVLPEELEKLVGMSPLRLVVILNGEGLPVSGADWAGRVTGISVNNSNRNLNLIGSLRGDVYGNELLHGRTECEKKKKKKRSI